MGTEADLKQLVRQAHRMGIKVMVDVVFNHVGYITDGKEYSEIVPFNKERHYHSECHIRDEDW